MIPITLPANGWMSDEATTVDVSPFLKVFRKCLPHTFCNNERYLEFRGHGY